MGRKASTAKAKPTDDRASIAMFGTWARDTVSVADEVSQHRNRRYNAAELVARVEGTIEYCVRVVAEQCNAVPIRFYTTATSKTGKLWGKSISRKRMRDLRNPHVVGKAAGYATGSQDIVEVEWHPIMDLLANPNPHMSGQEMDLLMWDHELTAGTAFVYVVGDEMPEALYPLYPAWVTPQPDKRKLIRGYWYYRGTPAEAFYEASEVDVYRLYPDRSNPYIGRSPLRAIIKQADLCAAIVVEALSRIQNDCRVENAWVSDLPILPEHQKEAEQRLQRYRGPTNKGKPVVLGGLKPYPMQQTYKDMEWKEIDERANRAVRNAYGVPESFADLNKSNLAGAETGMTNFHAVTIQPKVRMRAEQLTDLLLSRYGVQRGEIWAAPDNASMEDEERGARILVSLTSGTNPIITVNEARTQLGYEPVEWGDRPQFGAALIRPGTDPIDVDSEIVEDVETTEPLALPEGGEPVQDTALNGAQVTSLIDLASQVSSGQLPVDSAVAIARAAFPAVPDETIAGIFDPLRNFTPKPEAPDANTPAAEGDESNGESMDDEGESVESEEEESDEEDSPDSGESVKASGFWFRDDHGPGCQCDQHKAIEPSPTMLAIIRDWYADWIPAIAKADPGQIPNLILDARKQLAAILRPELERLFRDGFIEVLGRAGQDAPQSLSEAASRAVDSYVSRLSGEVTDTILTDVRSAIRASIEGGYSVNEARDAVAEAMGVQADWRAERVARTETSRAVEYGRIEGYAEVGVERKQWLISSAPCQFCEAAVAILQRQYPNGVPIRQPFFSAGDTIIGTAGGVMVVESDIMVPSDIHPNDACSVSGVWT